MSACANIGPSLDGYHDGELDAVERNRVERHLAACAVCRRDLASLGAVGRAVRATVAGSQEPDLWNAIARELPAPKRAPRAARRARAPRRRRWLQGVAAAAVAASICLVVFELGAPVPVVADSGPSGVVRSVYSHERPVIVIEAEKSEDPTIIWLMDEQPEATLHVRI